MKDLHEKIDLFCAKVFTGCLVFLICIIALAGNRIDNHCIVAISCTISFTVALTKIPQILNLLVHAIFRLPR